MTVLLTGVDGFIGGNLFQRFLRIKKPVLGIGRDTVREWNSNDGLQVFKIDQEKNMKILFDSIQFKAPNALILCDWDGVRGAAGDKERQWGNVERWNEWARIAIDAGVRKVIGLGSQAEISSSQDGVTEDISFEPRSRYGEAKHAAYMTLKEMCESNRIGFVWARLFSIYGPQMNLDFFLPELISKLLKGSICEVTYCEQLWNFLHVKDCVSALDLLISNDFAEGIFNIASREVYLLKDVVLILKEMIGSKSKIEFGALRYKSDEVFVMKPSIIKISTLGWKEEEDFMTSLNSLVQSFRI